MYRNPSHTLATLPLMFGIFAATLSPLGGLQYVCLELGGHAEIEILRGTAPGSVPTSERGDPGPCAADECGPCTDLPLRSAVTFVSHRWESQGSDEIAPLDVQAAALPSLRMAARPHAVSALAGTETRTTIDGRPSVLFLLI